MMNSAVQTAGFPNAVVVHAACPISDLPSLSWLPPSRREQNAGQGWEYWNLKNPASQVRHGPGHRPAPFFKRSHVSQSTNDDWHENTRPGRIRVAASRGLQAPLVWLAWRGRLCHDLASDVSDYRNRCRGMTTIYSRA